MNITTNELILGISFALISGAMNGFFTLPMKFLGRWPWENVWSIVMFVPCVLMPALFTLVMVPDFLQVLSASAATSVWCAGAFGFAWGFGAIMFGQGVSAIGISMGNTLALSISASLGSILPITVLSPEHFRHPQGRAILLGTAISLSGIVCFGYAGIRKERSQRRNQSEVRGELVGKARPFITGLLLCFGSGLLSAVFNIGYGLAQPIMHTAVRMGHNQFAGTSLIWLLMLTFGALPNLLYCAFLCTRNRTWHLFKIDGVWKLYLLAGGMGLMWGGHTYLYGYASPKLGILGPSIGWPLTLMAALITVNACGVLSGEWKSTKLADRLWMAGGVAITLCAIVVLGWSSTLE